MQELHWRDAKDDHEGFKISRSQDLTKQRHHIRVWRAEAGVWSWSMFRHAGELPSGNFQPNRKLAMADAQKWWSENHTKPIISIRIMHLGYPTSFLANTNDRTKTDRKSTGPKTDDTAPEPKKTATLAETHTAAPTQPELQLAQKTEHEIGVQNHTPLPAAPITLNATTTLHRLLTAILRKIETDYPDKKMTPVQYSQRSQACDNMINGAVTALQITGTLPECTNALLQLAALGQERQRMYSALRDAVLQGVQDHTP